MAKYGEINSGGIEKTNEEIEARLLRRARRRARRDAENEKPAGRTPHNDPQPVAPIQESIYSFADLSRVAQKVPLPLYAPDIADSSPTVEKLIAELIRPTLSKWLHENLPPMVERMVQDEVRVQSRNWIDTNLPPMVERLARETLRDMFNQAAGRSAA